MLEHTLCVCVWRRVLVLDAGVSVCVSGGGCWCLMLEPMCVCVEEGVGA